MEEKKETNQEQVKVYDKEQNQERVKLYDKEIYINQEKLKTIVLIIIVFLIGFVAGYFSNDAINPANSNNVNKVSVEQTNSTSDNV